MEGQNTQQPQTQPTQEPNNNEVKVDIDYDKIANILAGKQSATEDSVLKGYFKQQGLSGDEMKKAVDMFKAEKAKNTPDVGQLNSTISQLKKETYNANLEKLATLSAVKMGIDVNSIPYVLKLADFPQTDEEIKTEDIESALKKVLDDVPQFKPSKEEKGFHNFGGKDTDKQNIDEDEMLKKIFGV